VKKLRNYRNRLNLWAATPNWASAALTIVVGGVYATEQGPADTVLPTGLVLLLAFTVLPPIRYGRSEAERVTARIERIAFWAQVRERGRGYPYAIVSGLLIGIATWIPSSLSGSIGVALCGIGACWLSFAAPRERRVKQS